MKKGDRIVYEFGVGVQEAKVIKVFGDYLKVRHFDFWCFGFIDIIHKTQVLGKLDKPKVMRYEDSL